MFSSFVFSVSNLSGHLWHLVSVCLLSKMVPRSSNIHLDRWGNDSTIWGSSCNTVEVHKIGWVMLGIIIPLINGTVLNHCRIRILGSRFFHCSVKNIWGSWNQISLKAFVALLRLPDLEAWAFEEGPTATISIFSVKPCQGILFPSRRVCLCINSSCQLRSSLCSGIGQVGVGP